MAAITIPGSSARTQEPAARPWDDAGAGWDRHMPLIRQWLRQPTDAMLKMADVRTGMRVLDVAAGSGDQSLDVAACVGPTGEVVAVDISAQMLELARDNALRAGHRNLRTQIADGESLPFADASFDAVVCRLGLMFYGDPGRGVQEMRRVLRPGGRVCTIVFAGPQGNPCITTLLGTALAHAGLPPRDPFRPGGLLSLGRPGHLDTLFQAAGLDDVATTALMAPFHAPSANDYVQFLRDAAGPVREILASLPRAAVEAAWQDIAKRLKVFSTAEDWCGPNELLLTVGRR